jgi:hypothetical protein
MVQDLLYPQIQSFSIEFLEFYRNQRRERGSDRGSKIDVSRSVPDLHEFFLLLYLVLSCSTSLRPILSLCDTVESLTQVLKGETADSGNTTELLGETHAHKHTEKLKIIRTAESTDSNQHTGPTQRLKTRKRKLRSLPSVLMSAISPPPKTPGSAARPPTVISSSLPVTSSSSTSSSFTSSLHFSPHFSSSSLRQSLSASLPFPNTTHTPSLVPNGSSTSTLGDIKGAPVEEPERDSTLIRSARDRSKEVMTDKVVGEIGVRTETADEPQKVKKTRRETAMYGGTVSAEGASSEVKLERQRERGRDKGATSTSARGGKVKAVSAARNDASYGGTTRDMDVRQTDRQGDRGSERWTDRERVGSDSGAISNSRQVNSEPNAGERKSPFASWDLGPNSAISKSMRTPPGSQLPPALFPPFPLPPNPVAPFTAEIEKKIILPIMDRELTLSSKSEISPDPVPVPTAWNTTAVTKKWSTTF